MSTALAAWGKRPMQGHCIAATLTFCSGSVLAALVSPPCSKTFLLVRKRVPEVLPSGDLRLSRFIESDDSYGQLIMIIAQVLPAQIMHASRNEMPSRIHVMHEPISHSSTYSQV